MMARKLVPCWTSWTAGLPRSRASVRTNPHLDTLGSYSGAGAAAEVSVTDPGHPLYGRRFALVSAAAAPGAKRHVHVAYRGDATLRLPMAATSLHPLPHGLAGTKLTLEAIRELLRLAAEGEHPCPSAPARSGQACPLTGAASSSMSLPHCSGR